MWLCNHLFLLMMPAWIVAAISIQKLQAKVASLIQEQGFQPQELGDLLESILSLDPANFVALGMLALHHIHLGRYNVSLPFLARLEVAPTASQITRIIAGNISAAIVSIQHQKIADAIFIARRISASLSLERPQQKHPLHRAVEREMLAFAHKLDYEVLQDRSARQMMPDHYIPGLSTRSFWHATEFALARDLEESASVIIEEVYALRDRSSLWNIVGDHTVRTDTGVLQAGNWSDVLIFKMGRFHNEACESLPSTCALIKRHQSVIANPMGLALISELSPGTEVKEHLGYSNARITFHLPLRVPPNGVAGIRVRNSTDHWRSHKVLVFDDSLPHAVWHRGDNATGPRTVLLIRAWHPEISTVERHAALNDLLKEGEDWRESDMEEALGTFLQSSASLQHLGCTAGNCKLGSGAYVWAHGSRYEGQFSEGQPNGLGTLSYASGAKYEGAFRDGLRHGIGKRVSRNNACYVGEFKNNFPHGKGAIWAHGRSYAGTFEAGVPHGRGVISQGGSQYEGQIFQGMAHGAGRRLLDGKVSYVGEWAHDSFHGCGKRNDRWLLLFSVERSGNWRGGVLDAACNETACCIDEVRSALDEAEQARTIAEEAKLLENSRGFTCQEEMLRSKASNLDL